jgi:hypothetical protein
MPIPSHWKRKVIPFNEAIQIGVAEVAINCAMQPAELGRLEAVDYFTVHPETKEAGDWIIFDRPKTHEYGEWILWPEVAELLRDGIERSRKLNAERLIVAEDGLPWYREDWAHPEKNFADWWQANKAPLGIVTRLSKERAGFPRHTIKMLRKVLPNLIRPAYGKEISDLVNARRVDGAGRIGGRDTDRYADRLYGKVAEAIRSLEGQFRPFLNALKGS